MKKIAINNDALFVADSHYNTNKTILKDFLLDIKSSKIKTSQLFLLGDMFDFLASKIKYFVIKNKEIIDLINDCSNKVEIIYFEGNHDFNIKELFPKVLVISRKLQPILATYQNKEIVLAHGDIHTPRSYNVYSAVIRSSFILGFLNFIDINNWLGKKIDLWLIDKYICKQCKSFDTFANDRIKKYDTNSMIIEGHFHFGNIYKNYINVPSLHCTKSYYNISSGIIKY